MIVFGQKRRPWIALILMTFFIVILGRHVTLRRVETVDRSMRERLVQQAVSIAQMIDEQDANELTFTAVDHGRIHFERLRSQLVAYSHLVPVHSIFLLLRQNDNLILGPTSLPADDPHAAPSGTVFRRATTEDLQVFVDGAARSFEPQTDAFGTFVSVLAPVFDPVDGRALYAVGMDVEEAVWREALGHTREAPIVGTALLLLIVWGAFALLMLRLRLPAPLNVPLHLADALLVAIVGLSVVAAATLLVYEAESRTRKSQFQHLADPNAERVVDELLLIDNNLTAVANFFTGSEHITKEEFAHFSQKMVRNSAMESLKWAPYVEDSRRQAFEKAANAGREKPFRIWEWDTENKAIPAARREAYFPILYVEPANDRERLAGFDLGVDELGRSGLEIAAASGLSTTTEPYQPKEGDARQSAMTVIRPVFRNGVDSMRLEGFLLAEIDFQNLLRSDRANLSEGYIVVHLLHAAMDGRSDLLAEFPTAGEAFHPTPGKSGQILRLSLEYYQPVFLFGRCYVLICTPTDKYFRAYPIRSAWGIGVGGTILSILLALFVSFLRRRQSDLEREVAQHTASLQASLQRAQEQQRVIAAVSTSSTLTDTDIESLAAELTEKAAKAAETHRLAVWLFNPEGTRLTCLDAYDAADGRHERGEVLDRETCDDHIISLAGAPFADVYDVQDDARTAGCRDNYLKPRGIASVLAAAIRAGDQELGVLCLEHRGAKRRWLADEITFACQLADQLAIAILAHQRQKYEQEQARLQDQLQQAMKMEAIGRLAGGVAHDFNNILTGISGYAEIVQSSLRWDDPIQADVEEIRTAAERAAKLITQLLAFSRKQIIDPKVIRPNEVLENSQKMLRRIIGEDVDFVFRPAGDLWSIKVDPGQLDQILVNLAVNARDAMPDGGKLTIETQNVVIEEEYCQAHPGLQAGKFIMLAVGDNGVGMSEETIQHIFEPFFSTKAKGKGTGLGLATVYGILRQNQGLVNVYSELGVGTTFKIYFPAIIEQAQQATMREETENPTGRETVLLVEDEDMVRRLAHKILEKHGYAVIEMNNGGEAFRYCEQHDNHIDILLTDVVMPELNGKELYAKLSEKRPGLKVLFMSGYTENIIAHHGILDANIEFIQKPFTTRSLTRKIREVLDKTPTA
ncbi:MAG TPA: CHASE domain-containing protein [bacterium]|nr:CHASE domain-containing protein [bacterium]